MKRTKPLKFLALAAIALMAVVSLARLPLFACAQKKSDVRALANESSLVSAYVSEITMEVSSGRVLFENSAHVKRPMASTTKILTALTVINSGVPLDKKTTIKKEYCGIEGSSIYLREGENFTLKELLYGLMLRSGNDCAVALACETAGSVAKFADMMNSTAKSAGAFNSNFTNPHGLHDDNHYTTAYDLALISRAAMKNNLFREIAGSKFARIGEGESYRYLINKNKMLKNYEGATGIKTGFTKKAGRCLVSSAIKNGMEVVCVVLNCGPMFERSAQLLDESFKDYEMTEVFKAENFIEKAEVIGTKKQCGLYCKNSFSYPLKSSEISSIIVIADMPKSLAPPFKANAKVGKVDVYLSNQLLFSENIYTIIGVKSKDFGSILEDIAELWKLK